MAKKTPQPPRTDHVEGQQSMFTDRQLWSYKYGKAAPHRSEKR